MILIGRSGGLKSGLTSPTSTFEQSISDDYIVQTENLSYNAIRNSSGAAKQLTQFGLQVIHRNDSVPIALMPKTIQAARNDFVPTERRRPHRRPGAPMAGQLLIVSHVAGVEHVPEYERKTRVPPKQITLLYQNDHT